MNLGRAFTIIATQQAIEELYHADASAFYAPSECHGLIRRGERKREHEAYRHARAISGMSRRAFKQAVKRNRLHIETAAARIFDRKCPF